MTDIETEPEVLYYEQGASWWWVAMGPAMAVSMGLIEMSAGYGIQWSVCALFLVIVTTVVAVQVHAARVHTSVELTQDCLRQGTERLSIDDIVRVYPEAGGAEPPKWQSARALGELSGVPRGRTGIGLKLTNDRTAQAWARKHDRLRAQLTRLVEERIPPESA